VPTEKGGGGHAAFSNAEWEAEMRDIFGSAADAIITGEHTKYHNE
jgi:hypothetical protein